MPRYYVHLSDGLPIGSYYLKETGGTPAGIAANAVFKFKVTDESLTTDETDHGITGDIVNGAFAASVQVPKYDAQTGARLANVPFELQYVPEGSSKVESLGTFTTSDTGLLVITSLKKGAYTLTEKAHDGYVSEGAFQATFTIENGDEEMAFDLTDENHRKMIDFKVTEGAFNEKKAFRTTIRQLVLTAASCSRRSAKTAACSMVLASRSTCRMVTAGVALPAI